LGLFQNRVALSTAYYLNRSGNQLVGLPLPATTGFSSIQFNLPATVQNTGWEVELSTTNIERGNFLWNTSANVSIPRSKLVDYPNLESSVYASTYRVGEPLNVALSYAYAGIDETGVYQFEDLDGNGIVNFNDRT